MSDALYIFGAIVIVAYSIILHEVAHGAMAFHLGDDTAHRAGRLTLNPIPHIDLFGTVILPFFMYKIFGFGFGYAKPVPYNSFNLRHERDELKVALAGPLTNILIAIFFAFIVRMDNWGSITLSSLIIKLLVFGVVANIGLAVFNLVPIPPLDGSKILFLLIPKENVSLRIFLDRYGMIVLIFFVFTGAQVLLPFTSFLVRLLLGW